MKIVDELIKVKNKLDDLFFFLIRNYSKQIIFECSFNFNKVDREMFTFNFKTI